MVVVSVVVAVIADIAVLAVVIYCSGLLQGWY